MAKPMTRAQAIAAGTIIDCSAAAAFLGFTYPATVTKQLWDEAVQVHRSRSSAMAALHLLWTYAQKAVARAAADSNGMTPSTVSFPGPGIGDKAPRLALHCHIDPGTDSPVLTLDFDPGT